MSLFESLLEVNCISQCPIDSQHLLYAGVNNRMLSWFVTDSVNFKFKLHSTQIDTINNKLEIAALSLPSEFNRPVKDIRQHKQYKCTQHRSFLLYLSIVVLKDVIPKFQYDHFLLLFVGLRILSDESQFKLNNSVAKNMLREYDEILGSNFGKFRLIFSFHMLIHLADECLIQNAPLDRFAMWEFETANAKLKAFTRRQGAYLQQSYNRTMELYENSSKVVVESSYPQLKLEVNNTFDHINQQYKKSFFRIEFEKFMLDTTYGNCWFLSTSGEIVKFEKAIEIKDKSKIKKIQVQGRAIINKHNFFEKPLSSSYLNIFECCDKKLAIPIEFDVRDVDCKIFMIQNGEKMVFIPLLK